MLRSHPWISQFCAFATVLSLTACYELKPRTDRVVDVEETDVQEQDVPEIDVQEIDALDPTVDVPTVDTAPRQDTPDVSDRVDVPQGADGNDGRSTDTGVVVVDAVSNDVACAAGMVLLNNVCVVANAAPRPITPISLSDVTVLRPNFRWELPAGMDGATIELCRDRACTMLLERITTSGNTATPRADLPPRGVVFWRMRGRVGMVESNVLSPVWLFHTPAVNNTGAINSSANPHLDVNGDGVDDVAVGAPSASVAGRVNSGTVSVFLGNSISGIPANPATTLTGTMAGEGFGYAVASAGDVNGDGFGDLIVGASQSPPAGRVVPSAASVYLGSLAGLSPMPQRVLVVGSPTSGFGNSVACAGDVNLDGYADVVVGAFAAVPGGRTTAGTASVFHGGPSGVAANFAVSLEGQEAFNQFGISVASAGDVNGDGVSDLIVGEQLGPPGAMSTGRAFVYFGAMGMGISSAASRVLSGTVNLERFGKSVSSAGDFNNDGFSDVIVGSFLADPGGRVDAGSASVYFGRRDGTFSITADRVFEGSAAADRFGWSVSGGGDINGDGFDDVVIGSYLADPGGRTDAGTATVVYGSAVGMPLASRVLEGALSNDNFGYAVSISGDINGDGYSDVIMGSTRASSPAPGRAGLALSYHGGAMGVAVGPAQMLSIGGAAELFGFSVASIAPRRASTRWL